jgi:hypothetical protein
LVPAKLDYHATVRLWDWSDLLFMRRADDWPVLASGYEIAVDRDAFESSQFIPLSVQNGDDRPYSWEIKLPETIRATSDPLLVFSSGPAGLQTVSGKEPLAPGQGQSVQLRIETDVREIEDSSLGALAVSVHDQMGEDVSLQIIPVSVMDNNLDWRSANALDTRLYLPDDVMVNGRWPSPDLYALFGSGWYLLERLEDKQWRWARSPAQLYVFSAKPGELTVSFTIGELFDQNGANGLGESGLLRISTSDQRVEEQIIRGQPNQVTLEIDSGWNEITFALEAGNFRPVDVRENSSDGRLLSFTLSGLDISQQK